MLSVRRLVEIDAVAEDHLAGAGELGVVGGVDRVEVDDGQKVQRGAVGHVHVGVGIEIDLRAELRGLRCP